MLCMLVAARLADDVDVGQRERAQKRRDARGTCASSHDTTRHERLNLRTYDYRYVELGDDDDDRTHMLIMI